MPINTGACCPPAVDGVTYIKVGPKNNVTGMLNLDSIFQQLYQAYRQPQQTPDEELVTMARKFNYIPRKPEIEADYAAALRKAYTSYYAAQENNLSGEE